MNSPVNKKKGWDYLKQQQMWGVILLRKRKKLVWGEGYGRRQ